MSKKENFSLKKRLQSFRFAIKGIKNLVLYEHNSRIHLTALLVVIGLGLFFKLELMEWVAISIVSGIVILTELINTAIENLADIVEPKWNEKIGKIKDYSAGAVLVAAIVSVIVGSVIFIPKFLGLFKFNI
tara:strand:- start:329 stop:721 length:393 start_codon:yes stop_codon:yes gene_type:complete